ncbi:hypothetical protein HOLleu_05435 [Holothuria leucospilota]|uniref:NTR domain-containing protein n=1 Tax=Holothuria leucospilota TaxID=206669 RepID=A0A9Q1CL04_HOLLE|nr:hypothetical protein HOLleu_05435 [Holothuria leucospilota]
MYVKMQDTYNVFFFVILMVCGKTFGCLCPREEDTRAFFCKQDIVFQGRVMSTVGLLQTESIHDNILMYKVKVEKMFLGYLGPEVWLSTSNGGSSCGVSLDENVSYLLTTSWDKRLITCGWNTPMTSLTEDDHYVINRKSDCDT